LLGINEVLVDLSGMLERLIYRPLGDLIKHHTKRRLGRSFRHYLFGQVLADRFTFSIRVSREINCASFFGRLLQLGNNLFVVPFPGIRNYFVGRFEIIVDINPQAFGRQIFDVSYRGLNQIVLSQIFIYRLRLRRRFNYY
jgi:hypothetical protein